MVKPMIILSAGHSSRSPGASALGRKEHLLTAEAAGILKDELIDRGIEVVTIGQHLRLRERCSELVELLKKHPDAIPIELHFNSFNGRAKGAEAFVSPGNKPLFDKIAPWLTGVCDELLLSHRGTRVPSSSARGSLGWCRAGGCIWEICFMDNPHDIVKVLPLEKWAKAMAETLTTSEVYRK